MKNFRTSHPPLSLRQWFTACALTASFAQAGAQNPAPTPMAPPPPPTANPTPTVPPAPPAVVPNSPTPPAPAPAPAPAPPAYEPPVFHTGPQVRIDVLMVSLSQSKALALLPDLRDDKKLPAAQAQLLQMVEHKDAILEDWPEITTLSGQRAVCENIIEFRYPIEFDLPKPADKPAPGAPAKPANDPSLLVDAGMVTPTMFETKNTGYTLEAEPVVSPDGTAVTVNLAPQIVTLERMADYPAGQDAKGQPVTIQQPIFRTHKVQTNITLRDGERHLIYVGKPNTPDAPMHLFILGVKIVPAIR